VGMATHTAPELKEIAGTMIRVWRGEEHSQGKLLCSKPHVALVSMTDAC
jgi:hypothetical protein